MISFDHIKKTEAYKQSKIRADGVYDYWWESINQGMISFRSNYELKKEYNKYIKNELKEMKEWLKISNTKTEDIIAILHEISREKKWKPIYEFLSEEFENTEFKTLVENLSTLNIFVK